jgi:PIN domain nuclease of toxin-antitoxin system
LDSPVLLDTHAWIWLLEGQEGLAPEAVELMEQAAEESLLRVSIISAWEVGMLEAKGRLRFVIPCERWIERAFGLPGLSLVPLTPAICVRSSRLPGDFHGDSADRLIVSTAREAGALMLTRDQRILEYARAGYLKAAAV